MFRHKIEWIRRAQQKFVAHESDQAGSLGEQIAFDHLENLLDELHCDAKIYRSLRVPKHQGNGKYEIDLLLISECGILVVEVKHWGGQLSKDAKSWVQIRGQEKKTLADPVQLNLDKLKALKLWLDKRGLAIPQEAVHSLVVFTHPHVTLSKDLQSLQTVVNIDSLVSFALMRCGSKKRRWWQKKPRSAIDFAKLEGTLDQLPTWDRLTLHGGKICMGDLEYIVLPSVKPSALQRKYIRHAEVLLSRRIFPGIFLQAKLRVTDWSGQRTTYPLDPGAKIVFGHAGQNRKEEISWLHVETLDLGWKDHSYYDET